MIQLATKLSKGFAFVRVDFDCVDNKIYFGELTFTSGSGFTKIIPESFNLELGSYIKLPVNK